MKRFAATLESSKNTRRGARCKQGVYWRKALASLPDFKFELISVLTSPRSVTLLYKGARGRLVAEVFRFNADGKVCNAVAHYSA